MTLRPSLKGHLVKPISKTSQSRLTVNALQVPYVSSASHLTLKQPVALVLKRQKNVQQDEKSRVRLVIDLSYLITAYIQRPQGSMIVRHLSTKSHL